MKILITGATGLVGTALAKALSKNHTLTLVGRSLEKLKKHFGDQHYFLDWQQFTASGKKIVAEQDVIINLMGENIGERRWSKKQKEKIILSRVEATQLIADFCVAVDHPPRIINASAIGIYGFQHDEKPVSESTPIAKTPTCFLEEVGMLWESALSTAEKNNVSVVKTRFGVVLSSKGGALKKMLPAFSIGLGSILGDGKQSFSWVSLNDLVRAIEFIIAHREMQGAVNIVSPGVVSQKEFAKALARACHRPLFLTLPAFVVRMLFGQMGEELLLRGQCVRSENLKSAGFAFLDTRVGDALSEWLNKSG